jgi:hypothetical protein
MGLKYEPSMQAKCFAADYLPPPIDNEYLTKYLPTLTEEARVARLVNPNPESRNPDPGLKDLLNGHAWYKSTHIIIVGRYPKSGCVRPGPGREYLTKYSPTLTEEARVARLVHPNPGTRHPDPGLKGLLNGLA